MSKREMWVKPERCGACHKCKQCLRCHHGKDGTCPAPKKIRRSLRFAGCQGRQEMSTEKPSPVTDEEIAAYMELHRKDNGEYWNCDLDANVTVRQLIARIEADRAKILPSSCSTSHPEIRYQGQTCPLCEARNEVAELRAAGGALQGALCAAVFIPDGVKKLSTEMLDSLDAWKAVYNRAALSRPSSGPGDGEVGK